MPESLFEEVPAAGVGWLRGEEMGWIVGHTWAPRRSRQILSGSTALWT